MLLQKKKKENTFDCTLYFFSNPIRKHHPTRKSSSVSHRASPAYLLHMRLYVSHLVPKESSQLDWDSLGDHSEKFIGRRTWEPRHEKILVFHINFSIIQRCCFSGWPTCPKSTREEFEGTLRPGSKCTSALGGRRPKHSTAAPDMCNVTNFITFLLLLL